MLDGREAPYSRIGVFGNSDREIINFVDLHDEGFTDKSTVAFDSQKQQERQSVKVYV